MNASASAINKQFSSHPSEQRRKEQVTALLIIISANIIYNIGFISLMVIVILRDSN